MTKAVLGAIAVIIVFLFLPGWMLIGAGAVSVFALGRASKSNRSLNRATRNYLNS